MVNSVLRKYSDTPTLYKLIKCCSLEDVDFIRTTDFTAHLDKQNGFGWTVLHHACQEGQKRECSLRPKDTAPPIVLPFPVLLPPALPLHPACQEEQIPQKEVGALADEKTFCFLER